MNIPNYLFFIATFADGGQIFQNKKDESEIFPGRNCFFEVLQKKEDVPLICFVLKSEGYPMFGVDLRDGHFEVNSIPFFIHKEPIIDFNLLYFRDIKAHQHTTFEKATGKIVNVVEDANLGYILGWESFYKGDSIQRFI